MKTELALASIVATTAALSLHAATPSPQLMRFSPGACTPGLYQQPGCGPFSVFVFCDDAAGINIGVVNTSGAAGPGRIKLDPPKVWDKWSVNDRFWQERAWATDITSFAWSPDLRALYVGTSHIYGTGSLYKLDLVHRTARVLLPKPGSQPDPKHDHSSTITGIDRASGDVSVEFAVYDGDSRQVDVRKMSVKAGE